MEKRGVPSTPVQYTLAGQKLAVGMMLPFCCVRCHCATSHFSGLIRQGGGLFHGFQVGDSLTNDVAPTVSADLCTASSCHCLQTRPPGRYHIHVTEADRVASMLMNALVSCMCVLGMGS